MSQRVHIPTLLSRKVGISPSMAQMHCAGAVLSLDDKPLPIKQGTERFWLEVKEEDWGKKLVAQGERSSYTVTLEKDLNDEEDYGRRIT
jgi:hypothetical protein